MACGGVMINNRNLTYKIVVWRLQIYNCACLFEQVLQNLLATFRSSDVTNG